MKTKMKVVFKYESKLKIKSKGVKVWKRKQVNR